MPDNIYLISESYILYTILYLQYYKMAAIIQNGRQPNPKSRYLSFWISYLSDLSGLIKVLGSTYF